MDSRYFPKRSATRCWQRRRVGRVAVCGVQPEIVPVLYAMLDGDVVFRTAPGEKLLAAALNRTMVFEIDAFDVDTRQGRSVDVVGDAEEIRAPDEPRARRDAQARTVGEARPATVTCAFARST